MSEKTQAAHVTSRETEHETKGWFSGFFFGNLLAVAITQRMVFVVLAIIALVLGVTYRVLLQHQSRDGDA